MKKGKAYLDSIEREIDAEGGAWTAAEGRKAYLEWAAKVEKHPGYPAALARVQAQQKAARAMRRMRERAEITQAEIARRMEVKPSAVSRLERFGASTLQALFGYARACGYELTISAKSNEDRFAFA